MELQNAVYMHVLDTYELLELILMQLDLLDLVRTQRTNRRICSVIHSSPRLRRKLYFQCDPKHAHLSRINASLSIPYDPPPPTAQKEGSTTPLEPSLLNPLTSRLFGFSQFNTRRLENDWLLFTISASPPADRESIISASWRAMLLTSQPLSHLLIEPAALLHDSAHSPREYFTASVQSAHS